MVVESSVCLPLGLLYLMHFDCVTFTSNMSGLTLPQALSARARQESGSSHSEIVLQAGADPISSISSSPHGLQRPLPGSPPGLARRRAIRQVQGSILSGSSRISGLRARKLVNASERLRAERLGSPVQPELPRQLDHQLSRRIRLNSLREAGWRGLDQGSGGDLLQKRY